MAAANLMSSRSFSDSAGAEMPPPWRLSPLRSDSSPPTRTVVSMRVALTRFDVQHDLAVIQQQRIARNHVLRQVLVRASDHLEGARLGIELHVQRKRLAFLQQDLAVAESLDPDLRAAQIQQHADALIGLARQPRAPDRGACADPRPCRVKH